jgi:hypothetical protein
MAIAEPTIAKPAANVKASQVVKPIVYTKVAATPNMPAKLPVVNKAPVTMNKTAVATPAPKANAASIQLPAGFEKMNLSNDQRTKAKAIMDRYSMQIANLESQLNAMKASRDKELSAMLKPQTQLAKAPANNASKVTNVTKPAATAQAKPTANKTTTPPAATAPVAKDKAAKKSSGQK